MNGENLPEGPGLARRSNHSKGNGKNKSKGEIAQGQTDENDPLIVPLERHNDGSEQRRSSHSQRTEEIFARKIDDSLRTVTEDSGDSHHIEVIDKEALREEPELDNKKVKVVKKSSKIQAFFNMFRGMVGTSFLTLPFMCQLVTKSNIGRSNELYYYCHRDHILRVIRSLAALRSNGRNRLPWKFLRKDHSLSLQK